jgi:hypothetical protein
MYWDLVELPVAADYAHLTLELLRVAGGDETACVLADADLTIDIFARAALIDWFRGDYSNCVLHTDLAQRTLAATSPPPASAAAFKWLQALSLQLSGHLESALSQALAAASLYEGHHSAGSRVRIATVVADIALDLAERYVERDAGFVDTTGHAYLARATPFVENALTLARQTDDDSGEVLALLATARLARIKHDNVDRLTLLESAQWTAERLCDVALVGQTRTALGAELSSQGRSESALNCYREAMDVFAAKGIDGLGWRARRALLVHQEMTPA